MGRTGGDQGKLCEHNGGGRLCIWRRCDRGQSVALLRQAWGVERLIFCLLLNLLKVFTGSYPFSHLGQNEAARRMIVLHEIPDRPQEHGLTNPVWDMTVRCWQHEPNLRPKMTEVVATLREWQVFSSLAREQRD